MNTHVTLNETQQFEIDVFNSDFEMLFTIEGYAEIEKNGITFCVVSKVEDGYNVQLDNFVTKEWVISVLESNDEVKDRIESLQPREGGYAESVSSISNRM